MMRCEFLANVELCEEDLEHGGRLPLHDHLIKVFAHVWVLVPGISVPEVYDELLRIAFGVSYVRVTEDLVEDVRAGIFDDSGEHCHGIMVGHVFIGSTFQLFFLLSNITCVTSSAGTSQAAEILGRGRIRWWLVGRVRNVDTGEGVEEGRLHRQERVPMGATCQC